MRTVAYGPHSAQAGDLHLPSGPGPHPVAVLIHGGFWSAQYDRRLAGRQARDLLGIGYAAWNIEYRGVGNGGGWPGTFDDVAAAFDALDGMDPSLDLTRVTAIGHSAGGQLAVWASARGRLPAEAPGHGPRVLPSAVVSLAGVLDLVAGEKEQVGAMVIPGGAVRGVLGGSFEDVPARYGWTSPALLPTDVPTLAVHGTADELVPVTYSRDYHHSVTRTGTPAELVELAGIGHFELIDPTTDAWRVVRDWLSARLAQH